jgi:hypothetical protein
MRRPLRLIRLLALLSALAPALIPVPASAQPADAAAKPFVATAELGKPAPVGSRRFIQGSKEEIELGFRREVTLESAALVIAFAVASENIVAASNEKLLVLRAELRNPEKTSNFNVSTGGAIGFRLWQRYTGTGRFQFVGHYDRETLRYFEKNLKSGESARFVSVWRVPADFNDFRLGITTETATIVPWYDLRESIGRLQSVFAAPDGVSALATATVQAGKPFDIDGLELVVHGVTRPARAAGAVVDPAKPVLAVNVTATNRHMQQPVPWGWQYLSSELVDGAGQAVKAYPALYDEATDAFWSGDIAPSATARTRLLYYPPSGQMVPREFRLTVNPGGRSVTVRLQD